MLLTPPSPTTTHHTATHARNIWLNFDDSQMKQIVFYFIWSLLVAQAKHPTHASSYNHMLELACFTCQIV